EPDILPPKYKGRNGLEGSEGAARPGEDSRDGATGAVEIHDDGTKTTFEPLPAPQSMSLARRGHDRNRFHGRVGSPKRPTSWDSVGNMPQTPAGKAPPPAKLLAWMGAGVRSGAPPTKAGVTAPGSDVPSVGIAQARRA